MVDFGAAFGAGLAMSLAFLFIWSGIAKAVQVIRGRSNELEGLIPLPVRWRKRGLVAVLSVELLTAALILATPTSGLLMAFALLGIYYIRVATLGSRSCRCFGGALEFGGNPSRLKLRNLGLLLASLTSILLQSDRYLSLSSESLAVAGIVLFVGFCLDLFLSSASPSERGAVY